MKKLLAILFAVVVAAGAAHCGNSYKSPTAPAAAPGTSPTPVPRY
jgi:ABC-type glycerol-3-phosphate transport system substrate-binding protein